MLLPEHTWAAEVSYTRALGSVGLNFTGTGRATADANELSVQHLNPFTTRLPQNVFNRSAFGRYTAFHNAYVLADLNAFRAISSRLDAVFQIQNLTDRYVNDYVATYASIGRQVKVGARCRL